MTLVVEVRVALVTIRIAEIAWLKMVAHLLTHWAVLEMYSRTSGRFKRSIIRKEVTYIAQPEEHEMELGMNNRKAVASNVEVARKQPPSYNGGDVLSDDDDDDNVDQNAIMMMNGMMRVKNET